MSPVPVVRTDVRLFPDPGRTITRQFIPGGDTSPDGRTRTQRVLERILALPEPQVVATLQSTCDQFSLRHPDIRTVLERNFAVVVHDIEWPDSLSSERRCLIGAYFTHEYSLGAAALSNPSMVPAPSQRGVPPGAVRFIMSLRAIGEGHVSSIQFRSGTVDERGQVAIDDATPFAMTARRQPPRYEKAVFRAKLVELHSFNKTAALVLDSLPEHFQMTELEARLREVERSAASDEGVTQAVRTIHWLAASNYESWFDADSDISQRVLFPAGPTESQGIEDARFVQFAYEDGDVTYFAPYTAFDGYEVLPQLIETRDFATFRVATLNGPAAANKGIALFPRKISGRFLALARLDNENNYLIRSDDVRFWHESELLQTPRAPWELTQIGNCGSPIETEAGWLVITHGVGPMRQYCLGASLLDLHDPARVLGRLEEPLLAPIEAERDGYVPNVVYSCGSMIVGERLVLPYGFSDTGARIATLRLDDLLVELTRG